MRWEDFWEADKGDNETYFRNKLKSRHVDFLLYNHNESRYPALLIELNDPSHNRPKRKERDDELREYCHHKEIPLLIIHADRYTKYFQQDKILFHVRKALKNPSFIWEYRA